MALAVGPAPAAAQTPFDAARMVDVNGAPTRVLTLRLDERASDRPVFFLHGGAGSPLESWGDWISSLAELAPVVAYERPGIGRSPFDDVAPTPGRVVEHAHELLRVLDVKPPYILVGHSWGGPLMLYYAGRYGNEVAGMVYLDPTETDLTPAEYLMASNDEELAARRAELDRHLRGLNLPAGMVAEMQVINAFQASDPNDRGLPAAPRIPTATVLGTSTAAAGPAFQDDAHLERWMAARVRRFAERMVGRSDAILLIDSHAGHFVHLQSPGLSIGAARWVLERAAEASVGVMVAEGVLASFVGAYELAPQFILEVTLENQTLMVQPTNQPRLPLYPSSDTEYTLRVADARITFERDAGGAVTGLVLHQGGRSLPGRKIR